MKKALIFDPYLDTLGGGERYVLTFANSLVSLGYEVQLAWPTKKEITEAQKRFGLDLSKIKLNGAAHQFCSQRTSLKQRYNFTKEYDLVFWVSDGSLPFLFSKKNLVHLQVPFRDLGGNLLMNWVKSFFIHKFVYNSEFTKLVHETHLPKSKSFVLYPPIDIESFNAGKKENIILSVARFDPSLTSKHQDILIESFRMLTEKAPNYRLVMAGGLKGDDTPVRRLEEQAKGLKIDILVAPSFSALQELYSKARFFWHAAGFGISESESPEMVEHFGMTTVEAMSAGAVPVVIAKGGQKEIITPDSGFLCENDKDIAEKTLSLIGDTDKWKRMSANAIGRSKSFSTENFNEKIKELL